MENPKFVYTPVEASRNLLQTYDYYPYSGNILERTLKGFRKISDEKLFDELSKPKYCFGIELLTTLVADEHPISHNWADTPLRKALFIAAQNKISTLRTAIAFHELGEDIRLPVEGKNWNWIEHRITALELFQDNLLRKLAVGNV